MRMYLLIGALLALLGVMLGAFGAHGLKNILSVTALETFEVGVRYQIYHSLAIMLLGGLMVQASTLWCKRAAVFFIIGCVLFSGSIYLLALTGQKWLGPITPLGGLCFMLGWASVIMGLIRGPEQQSGAAQ